MKIQKWNVYRDIDGMTEEIGTVTTSVTGTKKQAWNKAAHKWLYGNRVSMGWQLFVEKGKVEEVKPLRKATVLSTTL